jgi:2-polyprenyl-6-methoxyphenol hydroxylase-like FAD-dependent oxidoreductase
MAQRVLIIGAGIAGPALAIALRRAGIESTVYEGSEGPRDNAGVFLNVAPNGLSVLRALGLGARLDGLGFQNDRLVFHSDTGRVLSEAPVGGITVRRGELSRMLREAAQGVGVAFEFGKSLTSVTEHDRDVIAHFADGASAHGTSLIGADGIHSRTRSSCFVDAPMPSFTGILNLGGITRTDLAPTGTAMHMIFGRRAFFGYAVRPGGETYWFSNIGLKEEPRCGALVTGNPRERLLTAHDGDPSEVIRILHAVAGDIGAWPDYDIPPLRTWRRGRICLLGDAAHAVGPHVGQGASLALEDAFVMAKCLREIAETSRALTMFESIRRQRVDPILKQSRRTGRQKAPTGWLGRKIRDAILPVFLKSSARAAIELYGYDVEAEPVCAGDPASSRLQSAGTI